jgi:hypothetical protein
LSTKVRSQFLFVQCPRSFGFIARVSFKALLPIARVLEAWIRVYCVYSRGCRKMEAGVNLVIKFYVNRSSFPEGDSSVFIFVFLF